MESHYDATASATLAKPTYACPTCSKIFKRPSTLNEHIRATHTDDRLLCSSCGKAFRRANDLRRHEKLHSGEKAYSCFATITGGEVGCGKRFARLHSLREHQHRRIGSTCWDAFVESQSQQSRASSPPTMACDDASTSAIPVPDHDSSVILQSIEVDMNPEPERPSYKPIDWLNWSMQSIPSVTTTAHPSRPVRSQPINPADISWHSVLESRLRHSAESIIASSRNSSFSSQSSYAVSYPVSTSA